MAWLYIGLLVFYVMVMFVFVRRPMYEAVATAFLLLCLISGKLTSIGTYLLNAANTYLLFSIAAFIIFSLVFEKTGVIDDLINIVVALVGRFSGGAGYVALATSAVMGTLCGSAPGTAAAVGVTTISIMKKTGFSSELAAAVESAASCLGPVIPPAGAITAMFAFLEALYPGRFTFSQFWLLAYAVAFWFILHRVITLFFLIRRERVKPIPKEDRLSVRQALRDGWRSIIVPLAIFIPFLIDALLKDTFIAARLGAASGGFTNILLTVIPSVASVIAILIYVTGGKRFSLQTALALFQDNITGIAPIIVMAFAGFSITELFEDLGVTENISASLTTMHLPLWFVVIIVPLIFTVLGMFIEPFSLIIMFGGIFVSLADSVGIHPMLAAMMFNAMTCGLAPMTPPFALSQFVCIGIAESDFKATSKQSIVWCIGHYVLIVLCMFGLIPMFGTLI